MSLLERLSGVMPKRQQISREDGLYKLVQKYRDEIEELRDRSFSWSEIFNALKAECLENGEWQDEKTPHRKVWNSYKFQQQYYRVRREAMA